MSSRAAWSTWGVPGLPRPHSKTVSQKQKHNCNNTYLGDLYLPINIYTLINVNISFYILFRYVKNILQTTKIRIFTYYIKIEFWHHNENPFKENSKWNYNTSVISLTINLVSYSKVKILQSLQDLEYLEMYITFLDCFLNRKDKARLKWIINSTGYCAKRLWATLPGSRELC